MLRRVLRSLGPHSSWQAFYKCSPILRQRTIIAPLRPSLLVFLGVSVTTFATIITIHGDATQPPATQPEEHVSPPSAQKALAAPFDYSIPRQTPPSPTADETFDLSSAAGIPQEKDTGISRIDGILLPSNIPCEDTVHHISVKFSGTLNYSLFGVYDGHNGSILSSFLGDNLIYETHVLSADQNGHNPHEVERLQAAHPGEKIVEGGRVLGWGMSRAFGDAVCKWSLEIQQRLHEEYLSDRPRGNCLTPPYFTAEPEITTTTIRKGDFVVLASDGLWDCLTNEEVVGLVGGWLETRGEEVKIGKEEGIGEGEMVMVPFGRVGCSGQNPRTGFGKGKGYGWTEGSNGGTGNEMRKEDDNTIWERTDLPVMSLKPDETQMYRWWRATKRFVNTDDNAAVHLARNALGGADRDLTGALLRLNPPRSRRYRDDICVQVIFFD